MTVVALQSRVSDNWFYLLASDGLAVLVDPVDAEVAVEAVRSRNLNLLAVLNTHWHPDHVSGDDDVLAVFPDAELWVPRDEAEKIADFVKTAPTRLLFGGQTFVLGQQTWHVVDTPGHTHGHISVHAGDAFVCGDVVFGAGAGNCYSGDPRKLYQTFADVLMGLSEATTLYFGHDYAARNLEFAKRFFDDDATAKAIATTGPFVPPTVGAEKRYNPFFRIFAEDGADRVRRVAPDVWATWQDGSRNEVETAFCTLRELRNSW